MGDGKKRVLVIILDMFLLALIVWGVYLMLLGNISDTVDNLLKAVVIISIPLIFVLTFTTFAGDKYDMELPEEEEDEEKTQENTDSKESQ